MPRMGVILHWGVQRNENEKKESCSSLSAGVNIISCIMLPASVESSISRDERN